jgi:mono/diheme cytochrome c family protein
MRQQFSFYRGLSQSGSKARMVLLKCTLIATAAIGLIRGNLSTATAQESGAHDARVRSSYAALALAPEKARRKTNPFEGDPDAALAGAKLYERHCAECHGRKAGGTRHGVSLLREEVQQATSGTLFWILTNGVVRRGMPVWSKLPDPQRWQLVTFLQSLTSRPSNLPAPGAPSSISPTINGGGKESVTHHVP